MMIIIPVIILITVAFFIPRFYVKEFKPQRKSGLTNSHSYRARVIMTIGMFNWDYDLHSEYGITWYDVNTGKRWSILADWAGLHRRVKLHEMRELR